MRVEEEGEDTEGCYPASHVMVHVHFWAILLVLFVLLKFLLLVAGATATGLSVRKKTAKSAHLIYLDSQIERLTGSGMKGGYLG